MKLSTIYANLELLVNLNVLSDADVYELLDTKSRVILITNSREYLIKSIEVDGNTATIETSRNMLYKLKVKDIVSIDLYEYKTYSTFLN
jgi:Fe2+ or Zn2+ uptake regulation protein